MLVGGFMFTNAAPTVTLISTFDGSYIGSARLFNYTRKSDFVKYFRNFTLILKEGANGFHAKKSCHKTSLDLHATYKFAYRRRSACRLTIFCLDLLVTIEFVIQNNRKLFFLTESYIDLVLRCIPFTTNFSN